ncbi:hypothetical protein [Streptomyces xanthophaeus]|uniref:Uncharacterized protein n=1 Tax=Streptomyces xanthophaeus TaxID=67385 RepID=A0A919H787_9ACTN|nr:hypothetical protein [Streptomyces xanthophaeus]WCD87318.1 hypothetical protein KPP03845_103694 [Streptomyces xanthophaeus]WST23379.1 hypothetical protein OG264_18860 [Streptomyces xanthophaeus]WST61644.1 hypothetical protein OG605_19575 [Streptomyces xanthophaeus]GHI88794.1 hypothetical protein Sxan_61580 [Streptomyces xanthophaeus]
MTHTRKRIAVVGLTAVLALPVGIAAAGEITNSRLPFSIATAGSKEDGDRWNGPGSGHAKACGDVPASQTQTFSGYVYQDKNLMPDPKIASVSKNYSSAYGCGSYGGTTTGGKYYTKATWAGIPGSRAYGFVAAEN